MSKCNHCWHFTGDCLTSDPPQYRHMCCHCGEIRNERNQMPITPCEHGEFLERLPMAQKKEAIAQDEQSTMEQIGKELSEWLAKRGVALDIVAMGNITNKPCDVRDFFTTGTHRPEITLVKAQ